MRRTFYFGLLVFVAVACSSSQSDRPSGDKPDRDKSEPTVVKLGDLRSTTPGSWKKETPEGSFRAYQFRLPRAEGDDADAQLVVFRNIGGSAKQNVERWKEQFTPPKGKTIEDVAKVTELKVGGLPASYLDIEGTFLDGRPGSPVKTPRPGYRMLAVQIEGPESPHHIKLTGPAATVEKHKKEFDDWLKSFK